MNGQSLPSDRISVVIPTRGRGALVVRTIRSILGGDLCPKNLIVVDQSVSDDTASAVSEFRRDQHFQYIRTRTSGVSAARNIGSRAAPTPIVAITDDDCEVFPTWLGSILRAFDEHPEASIVMGNVEVGPHPSTGFVPSYNVARPFLAKGVSQKHRVEGIGACFAYRTALWRELRGFDELLGAGARFRSAEEVDFMIRALAKGHGIYETPDVGVIHHGFRKFDEAGTLIAGHLYGIGAVSAKQIRCHFGPYLCVLARLALRWAATGPVVDFGHKPSRTLRLGAFLRGFGAGWKLRLDREGHFLPNAGPLVTRKVAQ